MKKSDNSYFSSYWKDLLREIATSKFMTIFEPQRDVHGIRIGQSRFISSKLTKASDDSFTQFPSCYSRHTTLAGIWMFLEKDHNREYLVTAFGKRKGKGLSRPAQFYGLHVSHGAEHNVNFSPTCKDYFKKHITAVDNAEILVCHNHPRNFVTDLLSRFLDFGPLPSNTDRETMFKHKYAAITYWLSSGNFRNIRFFLVQDRRLREIKMPSTDRVTNILNELKNLASA